VDPRLVQLLIESAQLALQTSLDDIADRCASSEDATFVRQWPGEHYRLLAALVSVRDARKVIDIGTYTGLSALALGASGAHVTTFDVVPWVEFDDSCLVSGDFARGLEQKIGDLSDPSFFAAQAETISATDLIFTDGPRDGSFEWRLAELLIPLLKGRGTLLVWDDIRLMNMVGFWNWLSIPKLDAASFGHWSGTGIALVD